MGKDGPWIEGNREKPRGGPVEMTAEVFSIRNGTKKGVRRTKAEGMKGEGEMLLETEFPVPCKGKSSKSSQEGTERWWLMGFPARGGTKSVAVLKG